VGVTSSSSETANKGYLLDGSYVTPPRRIELGVCVYERGFIYLILTQSSFSHFSLFPLPISTSSNPVPTPTLPPLPPNNPPLPYMYSFLTLYPFLTRYPYLTRIPPLPLHVPLPYPYPSLILARIPPLPLPLPYPYTYLTLTCTFPLHVPQGSPPPDPQCQSTHGESKQCSDSLYLKAF
jgi:hypothetical protein